MKTDKLHLRLPLAALLIDAQALVIFVKKYWKARPVAGAPRRPGLESVEGVMLPRAIGDEIAALIEEVERAQAAFVTLNAEPRGAARRLVARGHEVLRELIAALEWRFSPGPRKGARRSREAAQLAKLKRAHAASAQLNTGLALALEDFALFAKPYRKELAGVGDFDAALIDEAPALAEKIRGLSAARQDPALKDALCERNHSVRELVERMDRVRAAARFVFRSQPEVARQAASLYGRRERAPEKTAEARGGGEGRLVG